MDALAVATLVMVLVGIVVATGFLFLWKGRTKARREEDRCDEEAFGSSERIIDFEQRLEHVRTQMRCLRRHL